MTPFVQDADFTLYVGDVRDCLRELPAASVHTVVTSPPYWGLRDYGTGSWEGGEPDCDHLPPMGDAAGLKSSTLEGGKKTTAHQQTGYGATCGKCGATRVDQQIGLEPTPEEFVAAMVDVFREVRRVLRADGTLWLNLGDSYSPDHAQKRSATWKGVGESGNSGLHAKTTGSRARDSRGTVPGLKPKDLCGIPWRVAFALQADGWYLRSDIVWSKPNPMPESVTDRPTKAHEYVFLLTKSPRYFFDQEAVREKATEGTDLGLLRGRSKDESGMVSWAAPSIAKRQGEGVDSRNANPSGRRNVRSVWEIATQPYPEAHFATFPEALPERCIRAGTSERGCCRECGAPWVREVERAIDESRPLARQNINPPEVTKNGQGTNSQGSSTWGHYLTTTTLGWKPGCGCSTVRDAKTAPGGGEPTANLFDQEGQAAPFTASGLPTSTSRPLSPFSPVPCTVLDPFMGSGTVALVSRRLGRRSIGIELNPEYAALCARRLQQLSLLAEV